MSHDAARRLLVAGIGNIFCGDDGFGVEVARRLASVPMPDGVTVADFGIRGIHLAYELLDGGYDEVILIDALPLDAAPGTLAAIEVGTADHADEPDAWNAHGMQPTTVLALVRRLGGALPRVRVVGCQPGRLDEAIGLTPAVAGAVDEAVRLVTRLVNESEVARVPCDTGSDRRAQL